MSIIPGPGQIPVIPHPTPKIKDPNTKSTSIVLFVNLGLTLQ